MSFKDFTSNRSREWCDLALKGESADEVVTREFGFLCAASMPGKRGVPVLSICLVSSSYS